MLDNRWPIKNKNIRNNYKERADDEMIYTIFNRVKNNPASAPNDLIGGMPEILPEFILNKYKQHI